MGAIWRYKLEQEFILKHKVFEGLCFENEWFSIKDGEIRIEKGYAWDGCTPAYPIIKGDSFLSSLTNVGTETTTYSLIVLKSSGYKTVSSLKGGVSRSTMRSADCAGRCTRRSSRSRPTSAGAARSIPRLPR